MIISIGWLDLGVTHAISLSVALMKVTVDKTASWIMSELCVSKQTDVQHSSYNRIVGGGVRRLGQGFLLVAGTPFSVLPNDKQTIFPFIS
jgi:hypothetical protein